MSWIRQLASRQGVFAPRTHELGQVRGHLRRCTVDRDRCVCVCVRICDSDCLNFVSVCSRHPCELTREWRCRVGVTECGECVSSSVRPYVAVRVPSVVRSLGAAGARAGAVPLSRPVGSGPRSGPCLLFVQLQALASARRAQYHQYTLLPDPARVKISPDRTDGRTTDRTRTRPDADGDPSVHRRARTEHVEAGLHQNRFTSADATSASEAPCAL